MAKRDWRTSPDKPARVRVTKPDPETGEVVEITRAQSTLKAAARRAQREGEPPNLLELTADERRAIVAGRTTAVYRNAKLPAVDEIMGEKGEYVYIVAWDRPKSFADPEDGTVFTPDAHPSCWVTVTKTPKNLTRGKGWPYEFKVEHHGKTDPALLLKRGAGYTMDRDQAIDEVEAELSEADRQKIGVEARRAQAERRERDDAQRKLAAKRQEKAVRERLKEALSGLSPLAQQLLLAKIERDISEAMSSDRKAA
jgi:hypothetical protein